MGHTKRENLKDIQEILNQIRKWDSIKEKSPNVFYYKSTPFMHFHDKEGRRWADVKMGCDWGPEIEVPFGLSEALKVRFLKEIKKRYDYLVRRI